ncbi:MAG: hypothetical protein LBQ16_04515 [Gracilibacteraceae bacterium]|jgi:hypothetical protein|nr:hypothetical protein [Gracilibacteraceae bacterium]
MAEGQEFWPAGEEQEFWLTEEEVRKLLQGELLWREVESDRARAAAELEEIEAQKTAETARLGEAVLRESFAEEDGPELAAEEKDLELVAEEDGPELVAEEERSEADAERDGSKSKMPWEYSQDEREFIWNLDTNAPEWLNDSATDTKSFDFASNEMKRLLTEEDRPPSPIWRGAGLLVIMAALAAATFGVWWYFVYQAPP